MPAAISGSDHPFPSKAMKFPTLLALCLCSSPATFAATDKPTVPASDSAAAERARRENIRQLRREATTVPPLMATTSPVAPPTPEDRAAAARSRNEQERLMIEAVLKQKYGSKTLLPATTPAAAPRSGKARSSE